MGARPPSSSIYYPLPPPQPQQGSPPQWAAPGYAARPPPQSKSAWLIVIAVVGVAAIVVVAATIFLFGTTLPGPPQSIPTAVLQGGASWASNATVTTYSFTISSVSPPSANIDPSQLNYLLSSPTGTTYYSGAAGLHAVTSGFEVNVDFQDALDQGKVSTGDMIRIQVQPQASNPLQGGSIQVHWANSVLATGHM